MQREPFQSERICPCPHAQELVAQMNGTASEPEGVIFDPEEEIKVVLKAFEKGFPPWGRPKVVRIERVQGSTYKYIRLHLMLLICCEDESFCQA